MSDEDILEVREENKRLRRENERLRSQRGAAFAVGTLLFLGPRLTASIKGWLDAQARGRLLPREETAAVCAAIVRRAISVGGIAFVVGALVPATALLYQNSLIADQNRFFQEQTEELRRQIRVTQESLDLALKSVQIAREDLAMSHRPWVMAHHRPAKDLAWVDLEGCEEMEFNVVTHISNDGSAPALDLEIRTGLTLGPNPISKQEAWQSEPAHSYMLGPSDSLAFQPGGGFRVPCDLLREARSGSGPNLYVRSHLVYRGPIDDTERNTRLCSQWRPDANDPSKDTFAPCPDVQTAD